MEDVIIYSAIYEDDVRDIAKILMQLKGAGVKKKPKKVQILVCA